MSSEWHLVCRDASLLTHSREHIELEGRMLTLLHHRGQIYCIDSICYHGGGPLGRGPILDIEELGAHAIQCPWHSYNIDLLSGRKIFKGCQYLEGVLRETGWQMGSQCQRVHEVEVGAEGFVYVRLNLTRKNIPSDTYTRDHSVQNFNLCKKLMQTTKDQSTFKLHSGNVFKKGFSSEAELKR